MTWRTGDPLEAERVRLLAKGQLFGHEAPPLTLGRYVVLQKLGEGSAGAVYAAYDPELDRKIALKLLHAGPNEGLLAEAKAMARLRHPNVVQVYDVGTFSDRAFVTMELMEGGTLRRFVAGARPALREKLATLLAAGRGLAALHAAGLVHRDFKPDNVFVGEAGEVRVGDFGLARPSAGAASLPGVPLATGAAAGTPAYMSAEVFDGAAADERSDQFSFCATAYEVLYGARPFAGATVAELSANVRAGRLAPPPPGASVPAWVRKLLVRGLAARPEARFPSMEALLDALARGATRGRRWRWAAVVFASGVVSAAVAVATRPGALCARVAEHLDGAWDESRKAEVGSAFLATGAVFAADASRGVARLLDAYREAWLDAHVATCRAGRLRGEISPRLMDVRMACLDRRRAALAALSSLFRRADRDTVERAVAAAERLPPLAACVQLTPRRGAPPAPDEPALAAEVEAGRIALARHAALYLVGRYRDSATVASAILARARTFAYRPLVAEAGLALGESLAGAGDFREAERALDDALFGAEASGHDAVAARALVNLVNVVGVQQRKREPGRALLRRAEAAAERWGDAPFRAELAASKGALYLVSDRLEEAERVLADAASAQEGGARPAALSALFRTLAHARIRLGNYQGAAAAVERALALARAAYGPHHPLVASALDLADAHWKLGDRDRALRYVREGLAIRERALGPAHHLVGTSHQVLGGLLTELGRFGDALAHHHQALAILEKSRGPDHPDVAAVLGNLGTTQKHLGRYADARRHLERAFEIHEKRLGPKHTMTGLSHTNLASLALRERDFARALEHGRRALAIFEAALGPKHQWLGYALTHIGRALLEVGPPAAALPPLRRALALREAAKAAVELLAATRFALARALWAEGRERGRALELARAAEGGFAKERPAERREVAAWLAARAPGGGR